MGVQTVDRLGLSPAGAVMDERRALYENLPGDALTNGSLGAVVGDLHDDRSVERVLLDHLDACAGADPEALEERHDVGIGGPRQRDDAALTG